MRDQFGARRIGHQNLHQEAIELGFGQRIGAFHFDGILRRHHEERRFQFMRGGAAGDGAFLHGFEQRRLRFRRGAIDFVGQNQVGENRTGLEAQGLVAAVVGFHDHAADDVGGHEIGRELDARIPEAEGASQSAQKGGFSKARHAFEQHVAAREQADQNAIDHTLLTHDDFADFRTNEVQFGDCGANARIRNHASILLDRVRRKRMAMNHFEMFARTYDRRGCRH